ncbi:DUF202 domain-containing protein [Oerskovia flava]|uniref:DUF202 domain-containing protein n=1 Tax=Oerskovia flava TaxID=2986422 RepID=UPI00223FAF3B|nr:DUF202 domain-containing protein [Oerskovia sp. JB1-3-2]
MSERARDPGLQPERTALAWQRTVLGVVISSLLLATAALRAQVAVVSVLALLLAVLSLVPTVLRRPDGGSPRDGRLYSWDFLVRVVAMVVTLGVLGTVAAVAGALTGQG